MIESEAKNFDVEHAEATLILNLFGGKTEIIFYDVLPEVVEVVFPRIEHEAMRLQKIFNFFDSDSELSRLNRKRKIHASPELISVIRKAIWYSRATDGAYDVTKGRQFYSRKSGADEMPVGCSFRDITIRGNVVSLEHPDALIDLGSIAKGFIADRIAMFISSMGIDSFFIDARGDLIARGSYREIIDVQHPRIPNSTISTLLLKNRAVATSGDYRQFSSDYSHSHIVGKKDVISATAIAGTLEDADAVATCMMLLDSKKAEKLMSSLPYVSCLVINAGLQESRYNNFSRYELKGRK
ncbi:FAD:protein FMN transferase [Candidatus Woesearchaeota archaeon]|nr:MAG: FAD:protein FMN transferase [Candidatus Woesearchaeota archaeon]